MHIQGKGASHFAQLLLSVKDHSLHDDSLPPQSPVLSESSPATGSSLPGQAGSVFSNIVVFVLGILLVYLRCWVGMFFCSVSVLHGVSRVRFFWGLRFPSRLICLAPWSNTCVLTFCFGDGAVLGSSASGESVLRPHHGEEQKAAVQPSLSRHVPFRVRHLFLIGRCVFASSLSVIECPGRDPRFGRPPV